MLKDSGPAQAPRGIQVASAVLALSALGIACCAVLFVGFAAWPLYRGEARPAASRRAGRALRTGIVLTFVAVALLALSTAASWWPATADGAGGAARSLVLVSTVGGTVCGPLGEGGDGFLALRVEDHVVDVPLSAVTALHPVSSCA
ncbi:hypothetical protein ACL02U_02400 [Streptomyces sp. MS06]|uniref:hypothetical protein n=1 Tax=Streptomyces sp. MS06 TaxID=3385974 RepID=UPI0039A1D377